MAPPLFKHLKCRRPLCQCVFSRRGVSCSSEVSNTDSQPATDHGRLTLFGGSENQAAERTNGGDGHEAQVKRPCGECSGAAGFLFGVFERTPGAETPAAVGGARRYSWSWGALTLNVDWSRSSCRDVWFVVRSCWSEAFTRLSASTPSKYSNVFIAHFYVFANFFSIHFYFFVFLPKHSRQMVKRTTLTAPWWLATEQLIGSSPFCFSRRDS